MQENWVNVFDLLNKSKHQTVIDLFLFLKEKDLSDGKQATPKAYNLGFVKLVDGKERWNKKKYIEMMQADKKIKKMLLAGKSPHPKMYMRALYK